jgi:phage FluMu protein Com
MLNIGKCPKCEKIVRGVRVEEIGIHLENQPGAAFRGASYLCRHCNTVLGVAFEPADLKAQIVEEIVQRFTPSPPEQS